MSEERRITAVGRSDLIAENVALRAALVAIIVEADTMLAGGERALPSGEACQECGLGGVGTLRDALNQARPLVGC